MPDPDALTGALADVRLAIAARGNDRLRDTARRLAVRDLADAAPKLLAAVEQIIEDHRPAAGHPGFCAFDGFVYPCRTLRIVTEAVVGHA